MFPKLFYLMEPTENSICVPLSKSGFFRDSEPTGCVYINKKDCYEELAHVIMESSKSKMRRTG